MGKPTVLYLGEPIKYNQEFYHKEFESRFNVIQNEYLDRQAFMAALEANKFGDFIAIFRPHFHRGGEMGQWDEELVSKLPSSVRIFASAGAGYNWANTDVLAARGILYCNSPGASDEAVSDMAIYMILSTFRNLTRSALAARSGDPTKFELAHSTNSLDSDNLKNRMLGIVGFGSIGRLLAQKAYRGFNMQIHYYDAIRASADDEAVTNATFHSSIESLLTLVDCISLHTPYNTKTHHLIGAAELAKMKKGARVVNTARGKIIDENALIAALKTGHIAAAGLDVHYNEPHVNPELIAMDKVTLTCHNGGAALDTPVNFELLSMKNIISYHDIQKTVTAPVNQREVQEYWAGSGSIM